MALCFIYIQTGNGIIGQLFILDISALLISISTLRNIRVKLMFDPLKRAKSWRRGFDGANRRPDTAYYDSGTYFTNRVDKYIAYLHYRTTIYCKTRN